VFVAVFGAFARAINDPVVKLSIKAMEAVKQLISSPKQTSKKHEVGVHAETTVYHLLAKIGDSNSRVSAAAVKFITDLPQNKIITT